MSIKIITDSLDNEHVIVEHKDGSFTSMPKAIYDALEKVDDSN